MLLAHKIEIITTEDQEEKLLQWVGTTRHCYNNLLSHFSQQGVTWSIKSAREYLYNTLRVENAWYKDINQSVIHNTIQDLDCAYTRFFKKTSKYPTFHKRGVKSSFSIRDKIKFRVIGRNLFIEKFNKRKGAPLKLRERLRFSGTPKQVTISTKAGKWFASILVEVESGYNCKQPMCDTSVGIDLGIKTLVTTSDGKFIGKSNKLSIQLKKLAKLQQRMAKQKKGSNRRAKTKLKIQKLFYYVSCQKQALLNSASDYLTSEYQIICMEDLNVKEMLEKGNHSLSRMIADVGMSEFRRQIEYKAFLRGGVVKFVDQYFPSSKMCSSCGNIKEDLKLSDRVYNCVCGISLDRDLNAAINIHRQGLLI